MRSLRMLSAAVPLVVLSACADRVTAPGAAGPTALAVGRDGTPKTTPAFLFDDCDPVTFANIGCVGNGKTTLSSFVAQLQTMGWVRKWKIAPEVKRVPLGFTVDVTNDGGEVHTFTPVAQYGGGIVPFLNQLAGISTVAPECLSLDPEDFVAPGTHYALTTGPGGELMTKGTYKVQCCIHPFMQGEVVVQ